ncbi:MAG: CIA30 family protein [Chlorobiaceae bacterium]|nr:CIA30 family protein [Chlorobiaceae bacterium]
MADELVICDFSTSCLEWRNLDDIVMGGMSKSTMQIDEVGMATFSGILSSDRKGGFASVRAVPSACDFSAFDRFAVKLKGDGRCYDFRVRNHHDSDGLVYGCSFVTVPGEWMEVELPFSGFLPMKRGGRVPDAAPFNPSMVGQICFLVAGLQKGAFNLQIDRIRAVRA